MAAQHPVLVHGVLSKPAEAPSVVFWSLSSSRPLLFHGACALLRQLTESSSLPPLPLLLLSSCTSLSPPPTPPAPFLSICHKPNPSIFMRKGKKLRSCSGALFTPWTRLSSDTSGVSWQVPLSHYPSKHAQGIFNEKAVLTTCTPAPYCQSFLLLD